MVAHTARRQRSRQALRARCGLQHGPSERLRRRALRSMRGIRWVRTSGGALLAASVAAVAAPVIVRDDTGATVKLAAPAKRIVSLAPHAEELLFPRGAGARR